MLLVRTERFKRRHPSLRVKKMEGTPGIWELRVSQSYRITFQFVPLRRP